MRSDSAEQRRGWTGRGCLLGCLAPLVLIALALLVALPTVRQKWSAFQAENPWVAQVPGVAGVLKDVLATPDSAPDAGSADTTNPGRRLVRQLEGVDDKRAMPNDLPLWPRSRNETFSAGKDHAAAYQEVRQTPDSVLGFFRRAMPARGWRLEKEQAGAGGTLLLYRKTNRVARVEVVADTGGTDLWIRSRTVTAPGRR